MDRELRNALTSDAMVVSVSRSTLPIAGKLPVDANVLWYTYVDVVDAKTPGNVRVVR